MGCIYYSEASSAFKNELKTELNIKRKNSFLNNNQSFISATLNQKKNCTNIYILPNDIRKFKTDSKYQKSMKYELIEKNKEIDDSKIFIPKLSLKKINELFDDNDIENYCSKSKNIKLFSYIGNNNSSKKINIEKSLNSINSTFEKTAENSIEREYYKNNIKKSKKKKMKINNIKKDNC